MDWSGLAAQKYSILQQQADTASAAQRSQAGLQAAQAHSLGMLSPAQVAEMKARSGLLGAQATGASITNQYLPQTLQANLDQSEAQTQALGLGNFGTALGQMSAAGTPFGDQVSFLQRTQQGVRGFKKGTAKVEGKGDGTKDTVPAKLAPGEAVLNKAAAEHMGRGLIAALNKMGAEKMGLVPTKSEEGGVQHFVGGTEEVTPLAKRK